MNRLSRVAIAPVAFVLKVLAVPIGLVILLVVLLVSPRKTLARIRHTAGLEPGVEPVSGELEDTDSAPTD